MSQHCRPPCESPIEQRHRLTSEDGEFIEDCLSSAAWLGVTNVYITITRPDIAYVVGVVSKFMQKPRTNDTSRCRINIIQIYLGKT